MRKRVLVTLAALATVVMAFAVPVAPAFAQQTATVQIDFAFQAGGKAMSAGKYTAELTSPGVVSITGPSGAVLMPVITYLGRHDKDPDPEFVFDKVGGKLLLSEVWFPGQDGMLLVNTPGPHEHAVLGGSNPRK